MNQQVELILQQIEVLDESDRLVLEQRLQELSETDWNRQAENARIIARQQGIDQPTIDAAVEDLRYGK